MNKTVLKLAVPSILANITVPLVGMADLAIAGRLGDASVMGGIAIATMLFDLLYWNMGFLRLGTGGKVAQAYGRRNFPDAMTVFIQGMSTAFAFALLFLAIQTVFVDIAFRFIDCSAAVEAYAREYFYIRIWAAPATLSLYPFKGFFIGMQNAVSPMVVDVTVNVVNIVASILLALHTDLGFSGIAWGTLVAQYTGMVLSTLLVVIYYRKLFKYIDFRKSIRFEHLKDFFVTNADLFVRSLGFLLIYAGFTSLAAKYGDLELAVSSIMMKLMLLYSYFTDGFAFAGEALAGKYIGARDGVQLRRAVRVIFTWCIGIGIVSTLAYWVGGEWMVTIMTSDPEVLEASSHFLPWLLVMPLVSCAAFTWDGIYIGATATHSIRNSTIWAVAAFFASYFIFRNIYFIHSLWIGYMMHLVARTVYLSLFARKDIFSRAA